MLTIDNAGNLSFVGNGFRVFPNGQASLGGLDFKQINTFTYLNRYSDSSDTTILLYNSYPGFTADLFLADGRLRVEGMAPSYTTGDFGVGTQSPSTKLHVNGPMRVGSYSVAALPDAIATGAGSLTYVSDEVGGPVMALSDGTNWRRITDRAVVG